MDFRTYGHEGMLIYMEWSEKASLKGIRPWAMWEIVSQSQDMKVWEDSYKSARTSSLCMLQWDLQLGKLKNVTMDLYGTFFHVIEHNENNNPCHRSLAYIHKVASAWSNRAAKSLPALSKDWRQQYIFSYIIASHR